MSSVIIGIHGLDNKPPRELLELWWKKALQEGLCRLGKDIELPVFELVYWADLVYSQPLDPEVADPSDPFFLDEAYTRAPSYKPTTSKKMKFLFVQYAVEFMRKVFIQDTSSEKYSLLADSLLRKYFHELNLYYQPMNSTYSTIKNKIFQRTIDTIKKYKNQKIMLIGHSLGSVIGFDVLMNGEDEIKIDTFVTMGSPIGFPIILKKIAENQGVNIQQGEKLRVPNNITHAWYNISDLADNISMNYQLSKEFNPNNYNVSPTDMLVNNDYMYRGRKNPHSAYGYLRAYQFSDLLFQFIKR